MLQSLSVTDTAISGDWRHALLVLWDFPTPDSATGDPLESQGNLYHVYIILIVLMDTPRKWFRRISGRLNLLKKLFQN